MVERVGLELLGVSPLTAGRLLLFEEVAAVGQNQKGAFLEGWLQWLGGYNLIVVLFTRLTWAVHRGTGLLTHKPIGIATTHYVRSRLQGPCACDGG